MEGAVEPPSIGFRGGWIVNLDLRASTCETGPAARSSRPSRTGRVTAERQAGGLSAYRPYATKAASSPITTAQTSGLVTVS
jgi:hypothetical protein